MRVPAGRQEGLRADRGRFWSWTPLTVPGGGFKPCRPGRSLYRTVWFGGLVAQEPQLIRPRGAGLKPLSGTLETCNCSKTCWFVPPPPLQPNNSTVCSRAGRPGLRAARAWSRSRTHCPSWGFSVGFWETWALQPPSLRPVPGPGRGLRSRSKAACGVGPSSKPVGLGFPLGQRVWMVATGSVRGMYLPSPRKPAPSCGAPPVPARLAPLRLRTGHWNRPRRDLLGSEAAQVVALANEGFAFLKQVVGDRGARVQGFEVLTQLVQLCADVQEHEQNPPVRGVVAVMLRVALHLRGHARRELGAPPRPSPPTLPEPRGPVTPKCLNAEPLPAVTLTEGPGRHAGRASLHTTRSPKPHAPGAFCSSQFARDHRGLRGEELALPAVNVARQHPLPRLGL